jgi:CubicO group peptidase (beta-lactamase class C family)
VNGGRFTIVAAVALLFTALLAAPAHAAKQCGEPGAQWERATPAEAGMDAAKLQDAMDYGTSQLGFAVRVYRNGCLVGEDRGAPLNRNLQFESWSMAKSVVSLMFGRAMTKGLISADDLVGALVPEADAAHGRLTMLQLLTQTSGLEWNGLRDYNIFTQTNRVNDALTLPPVHPAGRYFEYAQSPVALLAQAISAAVGEDPQEFLQKELFDPLGIPADAWHWNRDQAGHIQGFYGVQMRPDDYARMGELLRRDGVWKGKRLLSHEYIARATSGSETNGCYGWLIWTNDKKPCIHATVTDRAVDDTREFPGLPADLYNFSGLFGQLVTVMPSQGIVVQRSGEDSSLVFAGGTDWESELYRRVLASLDDGTKVDAPGDAPQAPRAAATNADEGFQYALQHPDQYRQGLIPDPLPPAGPARARAAILTLGRTRVSRRGEVAVKIACPPRGGTGGCGGRARLDGARGRLDYQLGQGETRVLRFTLSARRMKMLQKAGFLDLGAVALNRAAGGSTVSRTGFTVRR